MMNKWWHSHNFRNSEYKKFLIGPFHFWIETKINRALVAHKHDPNPLATQLKLIENLEEKIEEQPNLFRVNWDNNSQITFNPKMADRAIVANFDIPFRLPTNEKVAIYISSPLWIDFKIDNNLIMNIPLYKPSDTWFGPSSGGELAYATKVNCKFNFEDIPFRPHRVVTKIQLSNRSSECVELTSLRIPAAYLSIFETSNNYLFTEQVNYTFQNKEPKIQVKFSKDIGMPLTGIKKVTQSRLAFDNKFFKKTYQYFFKQGDFHGAGLNDYDF